MSKLFVAFIFAALAFNCDYLIEADEAEKHDAAEADGFKSQPTDETGGSKSQDVASTTKGSTANETFDPIIMIVKKDQVDQLFTTFSIENYFIPYTKVRIVSDDQSKLLRSDETKMYLCPYKKEMGEFLLKKTPDTIRSLEHFEMKFDKNVPHKCSTKPTLTTSDILSEEYTSQTCNKNESMQLKVRGINFSYPLVEENGRYKCYREGILKFSQKVQSKEITNPNPIIGSRMIEIYRLCHNSALQQTSWIRRGIAPWIELTRYSYDPQKRSKRSTAFHKLVPDANNYPAIWEHAIYDSHISTEILAILKPLIDLIDDRLQQYSKQKSRPIEVITKIVYPEANKDQIAYYVDGAITTIQPEILITQAYDYDEKSAITFVIHHTFEDEKMPKGSPHCKEVATCDFMKWAEMSPFFKEYKNKYIKPAINFAYCCKTIKDEFEMPSDIQIENVMEMNWESEKDAKAPTLSKLQLLSGALGT